MFIEGPISDSILGAATAVAMEGCGAQTVFVGRIRPDRMENQQVQCIEFTSQTAIAEQVTREIIEEGKQKFGIISAEVWHSLGKVYVGQPCFLVVVHGHHRNEAYQGLEYIVNEFKHRSPVFGKELLEDGTHSWKKNRH